MTSLLLNSVQNYRSRCVTNNKDPACGGIIGTTNVVRANSFPEKGTLVDINTTAADYNVTVANFGRTTINLLYAGNTGNTINISDALLASLPEGTIFNIVNTIGVGAPFNISTSLNTLIYGGTTNATFNVTYGTPPAVILHSFTVTSVFPYAGVPPPTLSGKYLLKS